MYGKICGSISNNVLKTNFYEIYDDVAIIGVIFLSLLIYRSIEDFETKDYDKHFSSIATASSKSSDATKICTVKSKES